MPRAPPRPAPPRPGVPTATDRLTSSTSGTYIAVANWDGDSPHDHALVGLQAASVMVALAEATPLPCWEQTELSVSEKHRATAEAASRAGHLSVSVGVASGEVLSAVVGMRRPALAVVGSTINLASRMSGAASTGHVRVADSSLALLPPLGPRMQGLLALTEFIDVKGLAKPIETLHADLRGLAQILSSADRPISVGSVNLSGALAAFDMAFVESRNRGNSKALVTRTRSMRSIERLGSSRALLATSAATRFEIPESVGNIESRSVSKSRNGSRQGSIGPLQSMEEVTDRPTGAQGKESESADVGRACNHSSAVSRGERNVGEHFDARTGEENWAALSFFNVTLGSSGPVSVAIALLIHLLFIAVRLGDASLRGEWTPGGAPTCASPPPDDPRASEWESPVICALADATLYLSVSSAALAVCALAVPLALGGLSRRDMAIRVKSRIRAGCNAAGYLVVLVVILFDIAYQAISVWPSINGGVQHLSMLTPSGSLGWTASAPPVPPDPTSDPPSEGAPAVAPTPRETITNASATFVLVGLVYSALFLLVCPAWSSREGPQQRLPRRHVAALALIVAALLASFFASPLAARPSSEELELGALPMETATYVARGVLLPLFSLLGVLIAIVIVQPLWIDAELPSLGVLAEGGLDSGVDLEALIMPVWCRPLGLDRAGSFGAGLFYIAIILLAIDVLWSLSWLALGPWWLVLVFISFCLIRANSLGRLRLARALLSATLMAEGADELVAGAHVQVVVAPVLTSWAAIVHDAFRLAVRFVEFLCGVCSCRQRDIGGDDNVDPSPKRPRQQGSIFGSGFATRDDFGTALIAVGKQGSRRVPVLEYLSPLITDEPPAPPGDILAPASSRADRKSLQRKRGTRPITVIATDIVSFTAMSRTRAPEDIYALLAEFFGRLDRLLPHLGVVKHHTVGDAYVAMVNWDGQSASEQADIAIVAAAAMVSVAASLTLPPMKSGLSDSEKARAPSEHSPLLIRAGVASGRVSAAVLGDRRPALTLLGDVLARAYRLESEAEPGHVRVCPTTIALLQGGGADQQGSNRITRDGDGVGVIDARPRASGPGELPSFTVVLQAAGLAGSLTRIHGGGGGQLAGLRRRTDGSSSTLASRASRRGGRSMLG